jgi:phytoene dehydrogenase-like protein
LPQYQYRFFENLFQTKFIILSGSSKIRLIFAFINKNKKVKTKYDAIVVGSGPNGFAAAITLQRAGLAVLLVEEKNILGGGVRSAELTLSGFIHDVCSAVYPLGQDSPVFKSFHLEESGLEFLQPKYAIAHPFDDGSSLAIEQSITETASRMGKDADNYKRIFSTIVKDWPSIRSAFLGPLHLSDYTKTKAAFASHAITSAKFFARHQFDTIQAQSLFAGMAAHSMLPLNKLATSAIGIVLNTVAHVNCWPLPRGGAQQITNALAACFKKSGGEIQTGNKVSSLQQLPDSKVVLLDVTPVQLLSIAGEKFSGLYKFQLRNYKYGRGIFKMDWALSQPVPFRDDKCKQAATVHIGGTFEEIYSGEDMISKNKISEKPFVLFVQPGVVDASRAPEGKQTAWAYCHVPNGSDADMTEAIENQVERFAPGFKDCIIARHVMNTKEAEAYNSNYIGGDINGGAASVGQVFMRPAIRLSPYRTSAKGIYVCSSSTPPGGGVHGICGYYAARRALKDEFDISLPWL